MMATARRLFCAPFPRVSTVSIGGALYMACYVSQLLATVATSNFFIQIDIRKQRVTDDSSGSQGGSHDRKMATPWTPQITRHASARRRPGPAAAAGLVRYGGRGRLLGALQRVLLKPKTHTGRRSATFRQLDLGNLMQHPARNMQRYSTSALEPKMTHFSCQSRLGFASQVTPELVGAVARRSTVESSGTSLSAPRPRPSGK